MTLDPDPPRVKQRRPLRTCDICRQRKIRCDASEMPDGRCSNCSAFGSACTYLEPPKKRGRRSATSQTVDELNKENVELKAENAFLRAKLQSLSLCSLCSQPLQSLPLEIVDDPPTLSRSTPENGITSFDTEEPLGDQDLTSEELAVRFSQISLQSMSSASLGHASSLALVFNVVAMQEKDIGRPLLLTPGRPLFWCIFPWEKEVYDQRPRYVYPASDLITSLLHDYFTYFHPTLPILHRLSFERSVEEGLHLTDPDFGGTLLSVLAIASRYSNDSRVFVDRDVSISSGWKFASQVRILPKMSPPTIYEVQMYCLLTIYSLSTSVPDVSWLYLGLGIRCFQQRGDHRRRPGGPKSRTEHELWKRAFWSFLILERACCFCLGRATNIHIEDHDVEPPLEVDDEYWDRGFVQPIGKPSEVSYFVFEVRLFEILGDVMRKIYGSKKWKILLGWDGPDWEQRTVAEFDSTMNDFLDSIPPHLMWDPENPPRGVFFDQSAMLYINYQYLLISIHRPYIQSTTALGAPSLSICASAARAIIHTASIWLSKLQRVPDHILISAVFVSGIILVLKMLRAKRAGLQSEKNKDKDLCQVAKAMDILKFAEVRFQTVGRLWEVLRELWILECPPKNGIHSPGAGSSSAMISGSSPSGEHPQFGSFHFESSHQSSDHDQAPMLRPGMSIEQLLADADPLNGMSSILDNELVSMLMSTSSDVVNMDLWDAYIENKNIDGVANGVIAS
ncbi:fungal-specific transcription factor domain-containing protein [Mycena haematopus]|nr:fungal-specific transcription factor domain-containing protein [Mycena haematopus]